MCDKKTRDRPDFIKIVIISNLSCLDTRQNYNLTLIRKNVGPRGKPSHFIYQTMQNSWHDGAMLQVDFSQIMFNSRRVTFPGNHSFSLKESIQRRRQNENLNDLQFFDR